jgi:HEAT repeat protein
MERDPATRHHKSPRTSKHAQPGRGEEDLRTDGGTPSAGITPADGEALQSFLDEHASTPGFELTYEDSGTQQTQLLHNISVLTQTLKRPAARTSAKCTPVSPTETTFTVAVDDIVLLNIVEPPAPLYTAAATTPGEHALGLKRLASASPAAVSVSEVLTLIEGTDEGSSSGVRADALRALQHVAAHRPTDCTPAVPILRSLLREDCATPATVLAVLRSIGDDAPEAIVPAHAEISPYLSAEAPIVRHRAVKCVSSIAAASPGDVVDMIASLTMLVEDGGPGLHHAVYALSKVAEEYPHAVKPASEPLARVITDTDVPESIRLTAIAALGRVVGEFPDVGLDLVDDLVSLLDSENHKLRNNAIALIGDVALVHTDVVEPHVDAIAALLTVEDVYTRVNASGALSRVAADFPAAVSPYTALFIDLLDDENPLVRENTCWALGYMHATEAEEALRARLDGEGNEDVRERVSWALTQLDEH